LETSGDRLGNNRKKIHQVEGSEGGKALEAEGVESMENRKIENKKRLKQIAIDSDLHKEFKAQVAKEGKSIKEITESLIMDYLGA